MEAKLRSIKPDGTLLLAIVDIVKFVGEGSKKEEVVLETKRYRYAEKDGFDVVKPQIARDLAKFTELAEIAEKHQKEVGETIDLKGVKPLKF